MSKPTVKSHFTGRSKLMRRSSRQYACLPARSEERPATRSLNGCVVLDHAGEVEDIAPSARVDVKRDGKAVGGIPVEHGRRVARERVTREFLEPLLETFGRECGEILEDDVHGSAASTRGTGRLASRRSRRSLNHGRSSIRAGARWP